MAVIEQRMIGPVEAADLLQYNVDNRRLRERHIAKLASEMTSGNWRDTGIPIIILQQGTERRLQDGQHRLRAILAAGVTVPMTVSIVNREVFDVIDQGAPRNLSDLVRHAYEGSDTRCLATIGSALTALHFSFLIPRMKGASNSFRLSLLDRYPSDVAWAAEIYRVTRRWTGKHPSVGYLAGAIAVHRVNGARATEFFNRVAMGEMLVSLDPAYRLRAVITSTSSVVQPNRGGTEIHARWHEAVIRAWNGYVLGAQMHLIRISGTAPKILEMPEIMTENAAD